MPVLQPAAASPNDTHWITVAARQEQCWRRQPKQQVTYGGKGPGQERAGEKTLGGVEPSSRPWDPGGKLRRP